jgi:hypothetical protein
MQKQAKGKSAIKVGKGCSLIILSVIVLFAGMAALDGWRRYKSGKASQNWPSVEGVIFTSEVKTDLGKSDDVDPKYTAAITYRYTVEGYEYTGERVSFAGQTFLKKGKADRLVMRYDKGKRVKVYYDPKTPHVSVLEPGTASSGPPFISIMLVFILLFFLFKVFRGYLRKKKTGQQNVSSSYSPRKPPPAPASTSAIGSSKSSSGLSRAKSKPDKNLGILTLALLAAGVGLLAWGGYEIKRAYESRGWPNTQGTITSSYIKKENRKDSNNRYKTTYYPKVNYQYQVEGKYYSCNRIAFGGVSGGKRSKAKRVVDRYPSGKKVTVYYNPQDPGIGVLNAGFSWGALLAFLSGLIFFGVGVLLFKTCRRNKEEAYMRGRPPGTP